PLEAKRPVVRNPQNFGQSSWRGLSPHLLDAHGLGMWCGSRNGITVVDFDTPDCRVVDDFIKRAGDTPIKVQTASNKLHLWYQHNGEQRQIRPYPGQEIDILGSGLVALPPTELGGASYRFVEGGLNSLCRLPTLAPGAISECDFARKKPSAMREGDGRNTQLWRKGMSWAAQHRPDRRGALEMAMDVLNNGYAEPMADGEFQAVVDSVWSTHSSGNNWFGRAPEVRVPFATMDRINDANALALYMTLKRAHSGIRSEFYIAIKQMTLEALPWSDPQTTRNAIKLLIGRGLIVQTRREKAHEAAYYAFTVERP
ncbi:MAG: hypothetical protein O3B22_18395, partial [Proteobacteria bacterium]|nr:hypothetical protein [Pseudomonadota bacterium]